MNTLIAVCVKARGIAPFTLHHFVPLRCLYVGKDVTSLSIVGMGVASSVTEMFRFYILKARFTRKVPALVILRLHLALFHDFVTGRTFVY